MLSSVSSSFKCNAHVTSPTPHTQPHPNDTIVLIDGLTSAAGISLNGSLATVIGWDQELGRQLVQLPGRDPVRILLQNLLLPPTEDHAVEEEEEEDEEEDGDEEEHTDTKQVFTLLDCMVLVQISTCLHTTGRDCT